MRSNASAKVLSIVLVAVLGLAAFPAVSSASRRMVPQGFFGVDMDPAQITRLGGNLDTELSTAAASGVESVRAPLYWFEVQPYATWAAVPSALRGHFTPSPDGGAPYNWTATDTFMTATAQVGIQVLPILLGTPKWASDPNYAGTFQIPASPTRFADFCAAAVQRYGPDGSFWTEHPSIPRVPVSRWQVWNEPDLDRYWPQHKGETQTVTVSGRTKRLKGLGFAPSYVALLRQAAARIRATDSTAHVMLASMTNLAWSSLTLLYASGARGNFDEVAANVFSKTAPNIVSAVKTIRSTMATNRDSAIPYSVTEYSWSSASGIISPSVHMGWLVSTQVVQAKNAALAIDQFLKNRATLKLKSTFWYTWGSSDTGIDSVWDYAGMRRVAPGQTISKAVLATFAKKALAAEGCRTKTVATACAS
ncbi:MAG: hypothetical protein WCI34_06260 [Actinomycetes bacterium]